MEMPSVVVRLACGECSLLVNPQGTLLSKTFVSPILSVRALLALGYKVEWDSSRCRIWHPSRGVLDTDVSTGCPEISEQKALELIGEYEALVQRGESRCARLHCLMKDLAGLSNAELADVIVRRDVHSDAAVKKLVEKVFGDTPSDLREQAVASVQDPAGESFTWNRRMRRKFERAKGLVVHLFCGEGRKAFDRVSEKHGLIHVPVDTAEDLLAEGTYQYLLRQAAKGRVRAVIGAPPGRTFAPCRYSVGEQGSGVKPLRVRGESLGEYGVGELTCQELAQRRIDDVLMMRMMVLMLVAQGSNEALKEPTPHCLVEHPEDPEDGGMVGVALREQTKPELGYASFWATPEWQAISKELQLSPTSFHQGPLGHQKVRPTTIYTNMYPDPLLVDCWDDGFQSRPKVGGKGLSWSQWSPGLWIAVTNMLARALAEQVPKGLRAMDSGFIEHLRNNHTPFRRDCKQCIRGGARHKQHRKVLAPQGWCMSIDTAGPFPKGLDENTTAAKYLIVAVLSVPILSVKGESVDEPADRDPQLDLQEFAESLDDREWFVERGMELEEPLPEPTHREITESKDSWATWEAVVRKSRKDWLEEAKTQFLPKVEMIDFVYTEAVDSKKQQVVAGAISRMYARAISDGLSVQRIHTDRGKEYRNSALDAFCQKLGVHHTYAMAEEHQTNGRAEGAILKIKNRTRAILEGSGQDDLSEWPLAAKLASYHLRSEARKKLRMPCEPTVVAAWSLEFENYHGCHKMSLFGNFEGVGGENGRGSLYEAGSWEPKDVASLAVAMSKHVANIVLPIVTSGGVTESRMLENGKRLWETGFTYLPGTKSEYWGFKTLASVSAVVLRRLEIAGRRPVNGRGGLLSLCISVTQTTVQQVEAVLEGTMSHQVLNESCGSGLIGDTGEASGLEILPPPRPKATVSEEFPEWCPAGVYIACLVAELRALYMKLQGDEADTCSGEAQKGHGEVDASVSGEAVGCSDFEWDDDSQDVKMYQVPDCIKPLRPCHSSDVGDSCYTLERVDWHMCVNVADEMQELAEVHRAMCSLLDGQSEEVDGQCCSCEAQWLDEVQGLEQELQRMKGLEDSLLLSSEGPILKSIELCVDNEVEAEACQLDRKSEECMLGSGSLKAVQMDDDDPPPLQSKIVAQDQVRRELGKWRGSMGEEVESLVQKTEAVEDLTDDQYHKLVADPGVHVELIPGKMVYVWKSTGRRRARMVGCGNFCDNDGSTQKADLFASGAGAESIRMMIRKCTLEPSWHLVSVDVKTAFLQAPLMEMQKDGKEKVTVVKVPSILREAGVTATKYWKVKKALYGLNSAPRSWSLHRDRVMTDLRIEYGDGILRLRKLKEDANLWQILKYPREGRDPEKEAGEAGGQCLGIIALYVDDILVASEKDVAQAVVRGLESNWELSTPDWVSEEGDCLKFAGFELEKTSQGIRLHQESYTKDILEQYQDTIPGVERTPAVKTVESEEPVDRSEQLEWTKRAQSLIGQLLWLAGRTRPDIAYAVNLAAQRIVPSPGEAVARAEHLIRSADILGLVQAAMRPTVAALMNAQEVASDSSFRESLRCRENAVG
ncbi:unnamed protein product, partial [Symbiodinium sp. CCMP2592]